jgi:hypothetical protein
LDDIFLQLFRRLASTMSIFASIAANGPSAPDCLCEGDETQAHLPGASRARRFAMVGDVRPRKGEKVPMSTTTSNQTKAATLAHLQAMITGLPKHFPSGSFTLGNTAFTTASLVQLFQSLADAITAVNTAQASAQEAVSAMRGLQANVGPVFLALKRVLLSTYGTAAQTLADFGLEARKAPAPKTVETKAAAAVKLRATRKARGTTSKKQKLAVKGNVTGITVTPITTTTAAASPTVQPASNASNAPIPGASK